MHTYALHNVIIIIAGNPRRKVHQTELSGFKVFRPTTQELLFKPAAVNASRTVTATPRTTVEHSRPRSILSSTSPPFSSRLKHPTSEYARRLTFGRNMKSFALFRANSKPEAEDKQSPGETKEKVLPKLLFQQSPIKNDATQQQVKTQTPSKIHLPAIVLS